MEIWHYRVFLDFLFFIYLVKFCKLRINEFFIKIYFIKLAMSQFDL